MQACRDIHKCIIVYPPIPRHLKSGLTHRSDSNALENVGLQAAGGVWTAKSNRSWPGHRAMGWREAARSEGPGAASTAERLPFLDMMDLIIVLP